MEHLIPTIVRPFTKDPGKAAVILRSLQGVKPISAGRKPNWPEAPRIPDNALYGETLIQNQSMTELYGKDSHGTIYRFRARRTVTPTDGVHIQHQENGKDPSLDARGDEAKTGMETFYVPAAEIRKAPLYIPEANMVFFIREHEDVALHPGTTEYRDRIRTLGRGGYRIYAYATTEFYDQVLERSNHLFTVINGKTLPIPVQTYDGKGIETVSAVILEYPTIKSGAIWTQTDLLKIYDATYRDPDNEDQVFEIEGLPFSFDRDAVERAEDRRLEALDDGRPGYYDADYVARKVKEARKGRDDEMEVQKDRIKDLEDLVKTQKADLKYAREAAKPTAWMLAFLKMEEMRQKTETARQNAEKARLATEKSRLDARMAWAKTIIGAVKTAAKVVWGFFTGGALKAA